MKKLVVTLCVFLLVSFEALASSLPKKTDRAFVVDMACKEEKVCILSKTATDTWTTHAVDIQKRTGVQTTLIVVHGTGDLPFEQYANTAANTLRVGTKGNGGVVFLFDNKVHTARLEISRDLEGVIPDLTAKKIVELFGKTLAESTKNNDKEPLAKALSVVLDNLDNFVTENNIQKGGKEFIAEKDKALIYFAIVCSIIVLICSFIAVMWYNKRWYYTKGSLLGGVLCVIATFFFSTLSISPLLTFLLAFIVTYIFASIWHKAGDSAGWDIVDSIPYDGVRVSTKAMAEGVADFGGGGASEILSSTVEDATKIASSTAESCSPGACDLGGCDLSGCDIGGCDL